MEKQQDVINLIMDAMIVILYGSTGDGRAELNGGGPVISISGSRRGIPPDTHKDVVDPFLITKEQA